MFEAINIRKTKKCFAAGTGLMIGSVVGGFLNEKLYRHVDLIMSVSLAIMAFGCYMVPWSTSVPMAATAFAINGFAEGIINTGSFSCSSV